MSSSLTSQVADDGNQLTIKIHGRFDFNLHKPFREAYKGLSGVNEYVIDLSTAEYLDSSALGMLLLLREHAGEGTAIRVVGCNDEIRKIFTISNFDRLFSLS